MKTIKILRIQDDTKQTLGMALVFDGIFKVFEFKTLELPWKNNERQISCIPKGEYTVEKFNSPTFGNVFLFEDVPDRDMIEMHPEIIILI